MRTCSDQYGVVTGNPKKAQADNQHSGDGSAAKGNLECRFKPLVGSLCGPGICPDRDVHSDISGSTGETRTDREADCCSPVKAKANDNKKGNPDIAYGFVLTVEISLGALLNGGADFLHAVITAWFRIDPLDR